MAAAPTPGPVVRVAYEDASNPYLARVRYCLHSLGSTDPDEDLERMPPGYVANAESAGVDPGVVAATIYTSTHHAHPVAVVGVGVAAEVPAPVAQAAQETYRVEYTNTRGRAQKAYVTATSQVEAVTKASADAQSRGTDIDRKHPVKSTPDRRIRLVAEPGAAGAAEDRPSQPGFYAMWPDGRILSGPYANRYQAAPEAERVHGFVQFEAGEGAGAPAPPASPAGREAPRRRTHEDIEAALYQDRVYRKLNAQYYRAEPGSPQAAKVGAQLEKRRTELLSDPEFKVAETAPAPAPPVPPAAPLAAEDCDCKGQLAAEDPSKLKTRTLRWHRGEVEGLYHAEGTLGKYTVAKRRPDRRHGILPNELSLNGKSIRQFDSKGEAQHFASCYDAILPYVAPRGTPVEVSPEGRALIGGHTIVETCTPWVRVTKDPEKLASCAGRTRTIEGPRDVYDLLMTPPPGAPADWQPYIVGMDQEVYLVILLDVKGNSRGVAEVARGQRSKVVIDAVDILRPVVITGASSFWCVHNHPSADATPSSADRRLTKAIEKATKAVSPDVHFAGHIVVVPGAYADAESGKVTKVKA
jgi:RadC-like JAB domain